MILVLVILLQFAVILIAVFVIFSTLAAIPGGPFIPTDKTSVKKMISLAGSLEGKKAVDLGSGDGRIVIALAKNGAEAHGFEINPYLVLWSKMMIRKANLQGKAFIHWQNLNKADLTQYDVVVLYELGHLMKMLEKRLQKELPKGAKVISNTFTFPNWKYLKKEGKIYMYEKGGLT